MSGAQHKIVGIGMGVAGTYFAISTGGGLDSVLIGIGSALGCWLPDIDHDRSKLGRKRKAVTTAANKTFTTAIYVGIVVAIVAAFLLFKGLIEVPFNVNQLLFAAGGGVVVLIVKRTIENSSEFKWATKHRGLMHTLIPLVPLALLLKVSSAPVWASFVFGLMLGYVSHLIADCTTTEGCPLFYPLAKFNFRVPIFDTDKKRAKGCWILAIGSVLIAHLILTIMR